MSDNQIAILMGRLGAAAADALSPERQEATIREAVGGSRYFTAGKFVAHTLSIEIETDRIYDVGPAPAARQLLAAHDRLAQFVEREISFGYARPPLRRGIISEDHSHAHRGLQVADIAAGLAVRAYETWPNDSEKGVSAMRSIFTKILVNDRWVK
jgi:hypothetical protein